MKKILSLILAGLMTVSCAAFVAADDAAVEPANDAQTMVLEFLHEKNIWKGVDENEFVPDAGSPVQRYQMALLVSRISTGWLDDAQWMDDTANDSAFDDINEGAAAKFLGALSYANQNGIIEGVSATKFAPYAGITYRDALTMVVRTLGYKNLTYPWGYIEKAVELGLTADVTVPYTQELTRGEVAQILYAALFADTKTGESLAKSIFGLDFGWETIVITAANEASFATDKEVASDKYVGFNLIDEEGNIGAKTYYTDKSELGMVNAHDDELALGLVYDVLFSIDNDLAVIEKAYVREPAEYKNIGITNNAGDPVATQPIKEFADKYSFVKDRTDKEYLTFLGKELYIYEKGVTKYFVDTDANIVGVDVNGNIVRLDEKTGEWGIEWFYNKTLNKYYRLGLAEDHNGDGEADNVYVNWMTDAEFAEWYALYSKAIVEKDQYTLKTTLTGALDNPYAKLLAYNLDGDKDDVAEVALYKDYAIGKFTNSTVACGVKNSAADHSDTNKTYPSYKVVSLDDAEKFNVLVEAEHETTHEHVKNAYAWFNVDKDVTGFVTEDGKYNDGYILYNFDATSGEIDVIKYIPLTGVGMDADSYMVYGILNGYSTEANKIYIDGKKYDYGYDKLQGVSANIYVGNNSVAARYTTAAHLDGLLMQYVNALVVDGKIVDIDAANPGNNNNLIVVYDLAGVTSDGYIAVYGVSAKDGSMGIFKINSFNGWKKGDYRYYPENAKDDFAFDLGTLYFVKSYDAETNSYGVETFDIDEYGVEKGSKISISFEGGYRLITDADNKVTVEDAKDSDLYVIITSLGRVFTTTGKMVDKYGDDMYEVVDGYKLYGKDGKFVIYADAETDFYGFQLNGAGVGIYLYDQDDSTVLDAYFDDAAEGLDNFYLLGGNVSKVRVYNILTGTYDSVITTNNEDLEENIVYITIGNVVVGEWEYNGVEAADLVNRVRFDYNEDDIAYADYIALTDGYEFTGEDGIDLVEVAIDLGVITDETNEDVQKKLAAKVIDKVIYKQVIDVKKGTAVEGIDIDNIDLVKDVTYTADAVYNVADKDLIVYIYAGKNVVPSTADKAINDASALEIVEWEYSTELEGDVIEATLEADWAGSYDKENDVAVSATINEVALYFDVTGLNECDDVAKAGYAFGIYDDHDKSHFGFNDSYVRISDGKDVTEYKAMDMNMECYDCDDCDMVYYVSVDDLDLTLDAENDVYYVRFAINGDTVGNGASEGNNIEVVVKYEWTGTKVETSVKVEPVINPDVVVGELNSIDIALING